MAAGKQSSHTQSIASLLATQRMFSFCVTGVLRMFPGYQFPPACASLCEVAAMLCR